MAQKRRFGIIYVMTMGTGYEPRATDSGQRGGLILEPECIEQRGAKIQTVFGDKTAYFCPVMHRICRKSHSRPQLRHSVYIGIVAGQMTVERRTRQSRCLIDCTGPAGQRGVHRHIRRQPAGHRTAHKHRRDDHPVKLRGERGYLRTHEIRLRISSERI
ncbi:hypothetical protein IMSAGC006_02160 [Muribaculaceae bacterium]|nr:hypothetical protein IMSAGC006_02160 [Muribaculaceae bacterium]